jgi:hypothetical protein
LASGYIGAWGISHAYLGAGFIGLAIANPETALRGAVFGGGYSLVQHSLSASGICGCEAQSWALNTDRSQLIRQGVIQGFAGGGLFGIGGVSDPSMFVSASQVVVGGTGVGLSLAGMASSGKSILSSGLNPCNALNFGMSGLGLYGSKNLVSQGIDNIYLNLIKQYISNTAISNNSTRNRNPNDIDRELNHSTPPKANEGGTIGKSTAQNTDVARWVAILKRLGARDIRVNQEQVNIFGNRVGRNRPDLQFTLNGKRYYVEWDAPTSNRGPIHSDRIINNDPTVNGQVLPLKGANYVMPDLNTLIEQIILITMQ